jgi:uncharacterized protein (TIGR03067 family)
MGTFPASSRREIAMILLIPLLLAIPMADVDAPDLQGELLQHQGTWAVVRSIRDGKQGPPGAMKEILRVVEGDRVVWKRNGESFAATKFELDLSSDPTTIDLIPEGGPNRGARVLGIFTFEEDNLVICTADAGLPRPTTFEADLDSGHTLMTFRKVDPETLP